MSKCALHIVNEASVRDLREKVYAKYPDEKDREQIKVEAIAFRPNFIIDTDKPFEEDEFMEARISNIFMRLVGFCSRCRIVARNYSTCDINAAEEPTPTLESYRKNELGTLFGTYH